MNRQIVMDQTEAEQRAQQALDEANRRAERAEQELAELRAQAAASPESEPSQPSPHPQSSPEQAHARRSGAEGIEALRQDDMMRHLLDSLHAGKDIGHYGRLVFAMIARHFLDNEDLLSELLKDPDFSEEKARALLLQVEERDYSPPRRERILEWQAEQEFPIIPDPGNADAGNVYRTLKFPQHTYDHIQNYQEDRADSAA